jgi:hypothetical protein
LNDNYLIVKDKPDSQIVSQVDVPLTSGNEPVVNPYVIATDVYFPRVPATNSATWTDSGYSVSVKVSDPVQYVNGSVYFLFNHIITSGDHYHSQLTYNGTGNTYSGATRFKTFAGIAISIDFGRSIYPERMRIAQRPADIYGNALSYLNGAPKAFKIFASDDASCWNDNNHSSWTQIHDQTTSLSYVAEQYTIVNFTANLPKYRYYTMVVLSTIGNYGGGYLIFSEWNIGGDEKIDAIPEGNPITHKTLNFAYSTTPPNTYTLSVQSGTSIQVNNGTAQYLLGGNYTISVGATQSSVVVAGIGQVGTDPYPLTNGSTIAIRYSMLQRITSTINIKKDGLIKYVPASTTNPTTGSWNIIDIDTQPLTQFAGNLPANRLDNIDMSKVATGNLDWSRIASQPTLSALSGQLPISRTDGNLPASRLDNIDMGKVATGSLDISRVGNVHLGINNQFHRIVYAWENVVDTQGIWTNKFKINTNLHLNQYNLSYNYYQYFLSMSPNNVQDRHKYWFGTVKMSTIVGTDNPANTQYYNIISNGSTNFDIRATSSTDGVWWLNIWVYTTAYCESLIAILH